jgi:hypothetical protein
MTHASGRFFVCVVIASTQESSDCGRHQGSFKQGLCVQDTCCVALGVAYNTHKQTRTCTGLLTCKRDSCPAHVTAHSRDMGASSTLLRPLVMAVLLIAGGYGIRWYVDHIERLDASSMEYIEDSKHGELQPSAQAAVSCCAHTAPSAVAADSSTCCMVGSVLVVMQPPACLPQPLAAPCHMCAYCRPF